MDTIDGKDTLHATVGICYQNMEGDATANTMTHDDTSTVSGIRIITKRRQFDGKEWESNLRNLSFISNRQKVTVSSEEAFVPFSGILLTVHPGSLASTKNLVYGSDICPAYKRRCCLRNNEKEHEGGQ